MGLSLMDTYYEDFEVVHVLDERSLIDAESYQRTYHCARSRKLIPGYYVVSWPHETQRRRFDEQAEFQGPYPLCIDAWHVLDRLESRARSIVGAVTRATQDAPLAPVTIAIKPRAAIV